MPAPVEPSANFGFLAEVHAQLLHYATTAERLCVIDAEACLTRLRKLADWMARRLAREHGVDERGDVDAVLGRIKGLRVVGHSLVEPLYRLKNSGNWAVHEHARVARVDEAVTGLRVAWGLCKTYARHVGRAEGLPAVFVAPRDVLQAGHDACIRLAAVEEEKVRLQEELARRPAPMAVEELAARLCELATRTRTTLQFVRLAGRGHEVRVGIEAVFVERSFTADDESTLDQAAFLASLAANEAPRRVVVGAAGMGKTTLIRRLVATLGGSGRAALLVRLRALGDVGGDLDGLLDAAARWIAAEYALVVTAGDVERLLDAGAAVVLFDGFDELPGPEARARLGERLHAFAVRFPRAPVIVSSREAVLHQTALNPLFVRLHLDPFTPDDAARLTERLFVAAGLGTAEEARALTEGLSGRAQLRGLLSSPLTVTLLAFLRAELPALPESTCEVLEQCVRVWSERWPRAMERPASPIDRVRERALLGEVARTLVVRWEQAGAPGFGELVSEVARMLRQGEPSLPAAEAEMRAEDWLEHQLAHVGLLEVDDRGYVYFAHWSLMQYLAAGVSSAEEVAAWAADLAYQDLCALACELHAGDAAYLARLAAALVAAPEDYAVFWLLRSAAEGVAFAAAAVVAGCERLTVMHRDELAPRKQVSWTCSPRLHVDPAVELLGLPAYVSAMRAWVCERLRVARGEALLRVVVWGIPVFGVELVTDTLSSRRDVAGAAEDLLSLWPANSIGFSLAEARQQSCDEIAGWVAEHVDAAGALRWARSLDDRVLLRVAAAALALACGPVLAAALGVAITARALALGFTEPEALAGFLRRIRGTRTDALATPGAVRLQLGFRTPVRPRVDGQRGLGRPDPGLDGRSLQALRARYGERWGHLSQPTGGCEADVALPAIAWSPDDPAVELAGFVAACGELCDVPQDLYILGLIGQSISIEESQLRRLVVTPVAPDPSPTPQVGTRVPTSLCLRRGDPRVPRFDWYVWSAHLGEVLLALYASDGLADDQRRAYVDHRVQDRWVLEMWPLLEVRWQATRTAAGRALLLALGWSQHASTGQWPDTRLWSELVAPPAGDPWLVRTHAQLCWLACERKDAGHRAGLRQALREGANDPALAAVAAALRELLLD